jgi:hypothetical protein
MPLFALAVMGILGLASPPAPPNGIAQVSLHIDGVHTDADGAAVMDALRIIQNMKVAQRPTAKNPVAVVVPLDGAKYDLGDLARTVASAKTPNRTKGAPSAALILRVKSSDGGADALAKTFEKTCASLKGVDARKCRLDSEKKEARIALTAEGGAKLADIMAAFPGFSPE